MTQTQFSTSLVFNLFGTIDLKKTYQQFCNQTIPCDDTRGFNCITAACDCNSGYGYLNANTSCSMSNLIVLNKKNIVRINELFDFLKVSLTVIQILNQLSETAYYTISYTSNSGNQELSGLIGG